MSALDLKALRGRALASRSIDGDDDWWSDDSVELDALAQCDRSLIAALSPDVVLALLDRIEAAERVAAAAREVRDARASISAAKYIGPAYFDRLRAADVALAAALREPVLP